MHHGNYLHIFCPQDEYLQPANEGSLQVISHLRFRRKKVNPLQIVSQIITYRLFLSLLHILADFLYQYFLQDHILCLILLGIAGLLTRELWLKR